MTDADDPLARAQKPAEEALRLHARYHGKIQIAPKVPVRGPEDFAIWYTPGVAAPCKAIERDPELSYEHTNRGNTIAIVSDGTRVLGLGDIGPEAAMPVMEGKALLFKHLGGVDAVPLCLRTKDPDELVRALELLEPSFGGINLEDIAQPKCFRVLERAKARLRIPVWHDDQQGTATVVLAAVLGALEVVGKRLDSARIVMVGAGAAGVASVHLLRAAGIDSRALTVCDSRGVLHRGRTDIAARRQELPEKWQLCEETNAAGVADGIEAALRGADVCIAFSQSGPGVVRPEWLRAMAKDPIVLACANPVPEIWPWQAEQAGARVVATGRSDFPNQLNNSLAFPGLFRGVLDVRARAMSDGMALAAARELAALARERGLGAASILPKMSDPELVPRLAAATGLAAIAEGLAAWPQSREQLLASAAEAVARARRVSAHSVAE